MPPEKYHLKLVGQAGAGKSALETRLKYSHFTGEPAEPVACTEGYYHNTLIDGRVCTLGIDELYPRADYGWVTEEQQEHEIRGADGFLLVYSRTSRESLHRIREYYSDICSVKTDNGPRPIPMVLVANKSDMVDEFTIHPAEGIAMARRLGCRHFETSAKNDINASEAFHHLIRIIHHQRHGATSASVDVDPQPSSFCCRWPRKRR